MKRRKLLIFEDQFIIALDLKNTLENLGYTVTGIAGSGEECLELISGSKPDLVLMDIMLSGEIDGITAATILHEAYDIPVIYLTAHSDENSLKKANLTGPYGYIVKPIEEKDLYTSIEIALHRSLLDRELKKSEIKYRTLFEQSLDPIFIADETGDIVNVNQAMIDLFGYSFDEFNGLKLGTLFNNSDMYRDFVEEAASKGAVSNFEAKMKCKDGREIDVLITLKKFEYEKNSNDGYQGIIRDVTEYKMYFEEILRSRQEMRNLSAHIESMREKERTDIAREIHDVLGQSLTALRIDLSWLKKRIPPQHDDLIEKTAVMDDLINDVIFTVRRLSSMLRPGILDDLGLSAAIEWQASEFMKRTGIRCIVDANEISALAEDKAVALFRIFQESLTNIIKHAEADEVKISLEPKDKYLQLKISDNGKGIDAESMKTKGSYGIIGMRERVKALNGEIDISGSSSGTTILVAIPVTETDQ